MLFMVVRLRKADVSGVGGYTPKGTAVQGRVDLVPEGGQFIPCRRYNHFVKSDRYH